MSSALRLRILPAILVLAACSDPLSSPLYGDGDAGPDASDVGSRADAEEGTPDVGDSDAGPPDVGASDGGSDGGEPDATEPDAVVPDAADVGEWPPDAAPACPTVTPAPPPEGLGLDPFYTRYVDSGGIPIVGSDGVPAEAFARAHYVLANMLRDRPCIRAAIVDSGIRVAIMARDEVTTDIPEYADFYEAFPGTDWDNRGRGFGATLVRPATSGAVDNLMQDLDDPWLGENILLHEVAHSYWEFGIRDLEGGTEQDARLEELYASAMEAGLWVDTYANTNSAEYWAEGVQSWFNDNASAEPANGIHNWVDTRDELEAYDPGLADLIATWFSDELWPAYCAVDGPRWEDPTPVLTPSDCSFDMRTLRDQGCELVESGASSDAETGSEVVFVNRTYDRTLEVWWVDYEGELVRYGSVGPRRLLFQGTFEGHPWVVTEDGECVGYFVPGSPRARVIFE